jgi:hypothetical protein
MKKFRRVVTSDPAEIAAINDQFRQDVERYSLVYRCPRCIHVRTDGSCILGYPNQMLAEGEQRALDERGEWVFCKDFELEDG